MTYNKYSRFSLAESYAVPFEVQQKIRKHSVFDNNDKNKTISVYLYEIMMCILCTRVVSFFFLVKIVLNCYD